MLLECDGKSISELLSSPPPVFTPRRGILDTDGQTDRLIQENRATFYRKKLRTLISGEQKSFFSSLENIDKRKTPKYKTVRFGIVRSPPISPESASGKFTKRLRIVSLFFLLE